jgi:hypothetical protein
MAEFHDADTAGNQEPIRPSGFGLAVTLAALAAVGVGLAYTQLRERRLSKPEVARLKFYRYLRERGRLES